SEMKMRWRTEILRIVRFGMVGVMAALIYAAVAAVCYHVVHDMITATIVGQVIATVVSYFGHLYFSFSFQPQHRIFLLRFVPIVSITFGINIVITWFLSSFLGVPYQLAIVV